jgi:hypothetical protein
MSACTTWRDGSTIWRDVDNKIHRDGDLPAVVWPDGRQEWCKHGYWHRDGDLPAVVFPDGYQAWYHHGERHRDGDLPARVWPDGCQEWWKHGNRHREGDLPAVTRPDGTQEWWVEYCQQGDLDREQTRRAMAQAARWSPLRAAFVGAVAAARTNAHQMHKAITLFTFWLTSA